MKTIKSFKNRMWAFIGTEKANENEISFFDVKALYDAAYEEKDAARASIRHFQTLLAQAETLEAAYRAQLATRRPGPAFQTKAA